MSDISSIIDDAKSKFNRAVEHLEEEMLKIRAGKANPSMLNGILVEAYGSMSQLSAVCSISTPDARMLVLQPWDKSQIQAIMKAVMQANIGLNPQDDGQVIRIAVPPLTEERRKDLVKQAKAETEKSKVVIRNIRREHNESIRKLKSDGVSEDMMKGGEEKIQKLTDEFIVKVDKVLEVKEKEILTV
ncbi:MAG: ribosome recycling factor [Chitinophagales bacterium]|jgi:ribosome recycling factor|nr:ribosome recycling factor [Sphingobacteriales bacterium]